MGFEMCEYDGGEFCFLNTIYFVYREAFSKNITLYLAPPSPPIISFYLIVIGDYKFLIKVNKTVKLTLNSPLVCLHVTLGNITLVQCCE